jgi:hypothetical protein
MASSAIKMKAGNKGLTVKLNLFPIKEGVSSKYAKLVLTGDVTNADTGKRKKWNHRGELLLILGEWNAEKHQSRKHRDD